jgi:hypothetical protein
VVAVDEATVHVGEVIGLWPDGGEAVSGTDTDFEAQMIQLGMERDWERPAAGSSWRYDERWPVFPLFFYRFITRRNMIPLSHQRHKYFLLCFVPIPTTNSFLPIPTYRTVFISFVSGRGYGTFGNEYLEADELSCCWARAAFFARGDLCDGWREELEAE